MTLIGIRNTKILYVMKHPSNICAKCEYTVVVFEGQFTLNDRFLFCHQEGL